MKKLLLFICLATGLNAMAQNFTVTGTVVDNNGNPVANQQIYIQADSNFFFNYYNMVYTDVNGNYTDVIANGAQVGPNVDYLIYTVDNCNPVTTLLVTLSNGQGTITSGIANFVVCGNSQTGCYASFYATSTSTGVYSFTDASTMMSPAPNAWFWDFGDGNTSTQQNPIHTYTTPGTYAVCLTATNGVCTATYCQSYTYTGQTCQASFYAYNDTINNVVYLIDLSFAGAGSSYYWDFGDGNTSTQQYPTHTYASAGFYLVCLTVTDNSSCTSTYCDSIGYTLFAGSLDRSTMTINVIPASSVGIDEMEMFSDMNVYPNPTEENISLMLNSMEAGNTSIQLTDLTGKVVLSKNISIAKGENIIPIDLNAYNAGMYFITISHENGHSKSLQVIKK